MWRREKRTAVPHQYPDSTVCWSLLFVVWLCCREKLTGDARAVCRSPVFRAMFQHDTAEAQRKEVEMTDVEPDVAERMLDYIYTGNLHPAPGMEADLLAAADKYSLLELKESCEEVLCKDVNIETVLGMLVIADRHGAAKLKEVSVKFLAENSHTVRCPSCIPTKHTHV